MTTGAAELTRRKLAVERRFGPWRADNILLSDGVYTISPGAIGRAHKLSTILQVVSDAAGGPLADLRVLDLACGEGLFAVELARHGATVVAVEGRKSSVEKLRFVKDVLGLDRLQIIQDDVRVLDRERYGEFDAVLCLGILYHLGARDVVRLLGSISGLCAGFAVVDTHVSLARGRPVEVDGRTYWGSRFREHHPAASTEERLRSERSSLDNPESFWLTLPSLLNGLAAAGFTSASEVLLPRLPPLDDRVILLAHRAERVSLRSLPAGDLLPPVGWPEGERRRRHPSQRVGRKLARVILDAMPAPARRLARRVSRSAR